MFKLQLISISYYEGIFIINVYLMSESIKYKLRDKLITEGEIIDEDFGSALKKGMIGGAMLGSLMSSPSFGAEKSDKEKEPARKVVSQHEFGDITNQGISFLRTYLGLNKPVKDLKDVDFDNALKLIDDSLVSTLNNKIDSLNYGDRIKNVENAMNWVFADKGNRVDGKVDKDLLVSLIEFIKGWKSRQRSGGEEIKSGNKIKPTVIPYGLFK